MTNPELNMLQYFLPKTPVLTDLDAYNRDLMLTNMLTTSQQVFISGQSYAAIGNASFRRSQPLKEKLVTMNVAQECIKMCEEFLS
ncbi:hypothetical protein L596_022811 [Steinernema carpocapsae]|uniref:Uncharacterized protein n=1 Tax=Steinernema carpocapsae TaxID=34508 RepID=A0A4U5MMV0_STECR|nr:hypothetical protein L596_022811 [Steinernema carpocapsae]